jgi:hypothetical protein
VTAFDTINRGWKTISRWDNWLFFKY